MLKTFLKTMTMMGLALGLAGGPSGAAMAIDEPVSASAEIKARQDAQQRMTVAVGINGAGPFRFMVDTGAQRTFVSTALARKLDLPRRDPIAITSVADRRIVNSVTVDSIELGGRSEPGMNAPLLLSHHIGADGILGIDALQRKRVELNLEASTITLIDEPENRYRAPSDAIVVTGRKRKGQLIITNADIEGMPIVVVIDTGSEINIGNPALQKLMRVRGQLSTIGPREITAVTGATAMVALGYAREFRMGKLKFGNLPFAFMDSPALQDLGLGDKPAMLLGMHTLRNFKKVSIDFEHKRVHFEFPDGWARPSFSETFSRR